MTDDTFEIRGYGNHDDRATVQFDYQVAGQVYSTEHFLDTYGDSPSADELNAGLQNWLINEAKPQLVPPESVVAADLQSLVVDAPVQAETIAEG